MIKIDTSELDQLQSKLEKLDGTHEVKLSDLMTNSFVQEHSSFSNWQEFSDAGGIIDDEDFEKPEFSAFIAAHTSFEGYEEMVNEAAKEWAVAQLS